MEENTVLIMNVLRGGVLMVPVARRGGNVCLSLGGVQLNSNTNESGATDTTLSLGYLITNVAEVLCAR